MAFSSSEFPSKSTPSGIFDHTHTPQGALRFRLFWFEAQGGFVLAEGLSWLCGLFCTLLQEFEVPSAVW